MPTPHASSAHDFRKPPKDRLRRRELLGRAALAGGGLAGAGALFTRLPSVGVAAPLPPRDNEAINAILLVERLLAAFYRDALGREGLPEEMPAFLTVVERHERQHVAYLERLLGSAAAPTAALEPARAVEDADLGMAAASLEDIVVAAYNGQAANLSVPSLAALSRVASVDARHAAWARAMLGQPAAPEASDAPRSPAEVMAALEQGGFL